MYVVVIGGGNVGYYLTKELLAAGHEVVMIEKDPGRARTIADELGSIVIPNDGCEGRYQAEAGMGRADVMAAVTGDDEDNLVACQVAKMKFNVPRAIARVNNPKNETLFRQLAIDETVSPTRAILGVIEHEIQVSAKIITDLLDFAREREPELRPCPLRPLAAEAITLVARPDHVRILDEITEGIEALVQRAAEVTAPVEQCDCPEVSLGGGDGFAVEVGQRRMIVAERAVGLDLGPVRRRGRVQCPVDTRGPVVGEVAAEEATGAGRGRARQAERHPTRTVAAAAGEEGQAVEGGCRHVGGGVDDAGATSGLVEVRPVGQSRGRP